jgi:hypothetical protein
MGSLATKRHKEEVATKRHKKHKRIFRKLRAPSSSIEDFGAFN